MTHQKLHRDWVYQEVGEPRPGSVAVGYVCHGSGLRVPASFAVQRHYITEFAEKKGWKLAYWYKELGQNAVYEAVEQRPVLTQLLHDAKSQFQVVICFASPYWSRRSDVVYPLLNHLQQLHVWWATSDSQWDTNKVWQEGIDMACFVRTLSKRTLRRPTSQKTKKGEN